MSWLKKLRFTKNRAPVPVPADKVEAIRSHYEPRISPSRRSFEIVNWGSVHSQQIRFRVLAENVPLIGKKLLDVGCGLGDLWGFLKSLDIQVDYTGVDILEKMVAAARDHYSDGRFVHADIFAENPFPPGSFDVVFCSGTFNLNLGNKEEFLPFALHRMLEISREYLVFNLLHRRSPHFDPQYAYSHPSEILEILKPCGVELRILDDYLPNDFTVIARKPTS